MDAVLNVVHKWLLTKIMMGRNPKVYSKTFSRSTVILHSILKNSYFNLFPFFAVTISQYTVQCTLYSGPHGSTHLLLITIHTVHICTGTCCTYINCMVFFSGEILS